MAAIVSRTEPGRAGRSRVAPASPGSSRAQVAVEPVSRQRGQSAVGEFAAPQSGTVGRSGMDPDLSRGRS